MPVNSDFIRLNWLENQYTLHNHAEFLYVVDGYELRLFEHDDIEILCTRGKNIREAIDNARREQS